MKCLVCGAKVIFIVVHSKLMDRDTMMKFKEESNQKVNNKMLSHKFLKQLGSLSIDDLAKLAKYILNLENPKHLLLYLKMTIKAILSVLETCYTAKEWMNRWKRKQLVKRELHLQNREFGMFNPTVELVAENQKRFKECNVTRATMNVLLERPCKLYITQANEKWSKNKKAVECPCMLQKFSKSF